MQQFVNGRLHKMQQFVEHSVEKSVIYSIKEYIEIRKRSPVFAPNSFFITYLVSI